MFCGHLGATEARFWQERRHLQKDGRELEAEAVAYLVTNRLRLDSGSIRYLSGYLSAESLPPYSLDEVLKATGKIEEMIAGRFRQKRDQSSEVQKFKKTSNAFQAQRCGLISITVIGHGTNRHEWMRDKTPRLIPDVRVQQTR